MMNGKQISEQAMPVSLTVNGVPSTGETEPRTTLADFLRQDLGLTGTHVGCEHGVCGACTVLVDGEPVRSCLMLAVQAEGSEVETIEGLASDGELHPIQRAFRANHSFQCGFCTPGFVMSTCALLKEADGELTDEEIRTALAGNICRCTGYESIVAGVRAAAKEV
jgi:carbon-monoxide dehydrogenase small subunit